MFVLAYISRR